MPLDLLDTTVVLHVAASAPRQQLAETLEEVLHGPGSEQRGLLLVCAEAERSDLQSWLMPRWPGVAVVAYAPSDTSTCMRRVSHHLRGDWLAFLPHDMSFCPLSALCALRKGGSIAPWLLPAKAPVDKAIY